MIAYCIARYKYNCVLYSQLPIPNLIGGPSKAVLDLKKGILVLKYGIHSVTICEKSGTRIIEYLFK